MVQLNQNNNDAIESQMVAPAPWELQGSGYICVLQSPELRDHCFIPNSLQDKHKNNSYSLLMFIDYKQSPVGPYYELLFIPGRFNFEVTNYYFSISRIFVSSMASVTNGRRNWGIPKEIAEFEVHYDKQGVDHVIITHNGTDVAELIFTGLTCLRFPFHTSFIPRTWHTLGQHDANNVFVYCPTGKGWLRPARLIKANINPVEFPNIRINQVIATLNITHFKMHFPTAKKTLIK